MEPSFTTPSELTPLLGLTKSYTVHTCAILFLNKDHLGIRPCHPWPWMVLIIINYNNMQFSAFPCLKSRVSLYQLRDILCSTAANFAAVVWATILLRFAACFNGCSCNCRQATCTLVSWPTIILRTLHCTHPQNINSSSVYKINLLIKFTN